MSSKTDHQTILDRKFQNTLKYQQSANDFEM